MSAMEALPDVLLWLTTDFVQPLLQQDEQDPALIVEAVHVTSAVAKGENFGSFLHRADATVKKAGRLEHRHLMVKSLPAGEVLLALIKELQIFEKETRVYLEVLPAYRKLQEASGTAVTPLGGKCYPTSRPHTIVMEDLSRRGFRVADRLAGLDLAHSTLALQAIARFHALSLGLSRDGWNLAAEFPVVFLSPAKRAETHYQQDRNVSALVREVRSWPGFQRYADQLQASAFLDKVTDLLGLTNKFSVLAHGDCWLNNMMFRYSDGGDVEEVLLVDFQISSYRSLAYDIHYFFHSSVKEAVRTGSWDAVVDAYHASFVATLESIGLPAVFSVDELRQELADTYSFALLTAFLVLPIALASPEDAPDLTQIPEYKAVCEGDGEKVSYMATTYAGASFRKALQGMLPEFERAGVL